MLDTDGSRDPGHRTSSKARRRTRRRGAGVEEVRRTPTVSSEVDVGDAASFDSDDPSGFTGGMGEQRGAGHNRFAALAPTKSLPETTPSTTGPVLAPPSSAFSFACSRIPLRKSTPGPLAAVSKPSASVVTESKPSASMAAKPTTPLEIATLVDTFIPSAPLTASPTSIFAIPKPPSPQRPQAPLHPPGLPIPVSKSTPLPQHIEDTLPAAVQTVTDSKDLTNPSGWPTTPLTNPSEPLKPRTKDGRSRFFPKKKTGAVDTPYLTGNEKEAILKAQEVVLPPPAATRGGGLWQKASVGQEKEKKRPSPLDLSLNGASPNIGHKIAVAGPLTPPESPPKSPDFPPSYSSVVKQPGPIAPPAGSKHVRKGILLPARACKIFGGAVGTGKRDGAAGDIASEAPEECEKLIDDSCPDDGDKLKVEWGRKVSLGEFTSEEESGGEWEGARAEFWVRELVG